MESKQCTICHEVKSLSEFYTRKVVTKKNGVRIKHVAECKSCNVQRYMKWREDNPEKYQVAWDRYAQSDKRKQGKRQERKNNREQYSEYHKQWRHNNPDKTKEYSEKRQERFNAVYKDFKKNEWQDCLFFFDNCCAYCGSDGKLQREHIVPISKGGAHTALNVLPACKGCNASKYDSDFHDWYPRFEFYSEDRNSKITEYFAFVERKKSEQKAV